MGIEPEFNFMSKNIIPSLTVLNGGTIFGQSSVGTIKPTGVLTNSFTGHAGRAGQVGGSLPATASYSDAASHAEKLTQLAKDASDGNKKSFHEGAAEAHGLAGKLATEGGDASKAAYHSQKEKEHRTEMTSASVNATGAFRKGRILKADDSDISPNAGEENHGNYIAHYQGRQVGVKAASQYDAQKIAAEHFKAKKSYQVNVMLHSKGDGSNPIVHRAVD